MVFLRFLRLPVAMVLALGLSGAIFWILWTLVHVKIDIGEMKKATRIEFTRMRKDTETASKREEKPERERPQVTPEVPRMSIASGGVDNNIAMLAPVVDTSGPIGVQIGAGGSDRDVMPLVRINPDYPQRALSRGIEGWVVVQFTITAAGTVKDAIVVDSDPKGIFDNAAIKAILRWRYNPKVEGGEAVERVGVQTMLRFDIEK